MDKKSIGIIAVVILALVVGGVLVISSQNKNNNESTDNSSQNVSDTTSTTINDNKYSRYQEATILDMLNIKVENKKLVVSIEGKNIKVSNLPSDIKYFTYVKYCSNYIEIAAITNSNEVYFGTTYLLELLKDSTIDEETRQSDINEENIEFQKVEGSDIVGLALSAEKRGPVTCRDEFICAVTKDGSLKEISYDMEGEKVILKN